MYTVTLTAEFDSKSAIHATELAFELVQLILEQPNIRSAQLEKLNDYIDEDEPSPLYQDTAEYNEYPGHVL